MVKVLDALSDADSVSSLENCDIDALKSLSNDLLYFCKFDSCLDCEPLVKPSSFLRHLKQTHNIEIHKPNFVIPFLQSYAENIFAKCASHNQEKVVFGTDDAEERTKLQTEKLKQVIEIQENERKTTHIQSRECLLCHQRQENYSTLFSHMFNEHNFNIGLLDNLVNVDQFLSTLSLKLDSKQCIYCEKFFKNTSTLKKHLKTKQHLRVHHKNPTYDRFYMVNYLNLGENTPSVIDSVDEDQWSDWKEVEPSNAVCLFCQQMDLPDLTFEHMKQIHGFDLLDIAKDSYSYIKIVNFIRRKVLICECVHCRQKFSSSVELLTHMKTANHFSIVKADWDKPEYFFPVDEEDLLLQSIPFDEDSD